MSSTCNIWSSGAVTVRVSKSYVAVYAALSDDCRRRKDETAILGAESFGKILELPEIQSVINVSS